VPVPTELADGLALAVGERFLQITAGFAPKVGSPAPRIGAPGTRHHLPTPTCWEGCGRFLVFGLIVALPGLALAVFAGGWAKGIGIAVEAIAARSGPPGRC